MTADQKEKISFCIDHWEHIRGWEEEYIFSLYELGDDVQLSDKQQNKLNQIYRKVLTETEKTA